MKVSVIVPTYNHERFIEACLQGIVDQETNFAYEVLVGEDASTDGTRAICESFARRYPEMIRLFLNDDPKDKIRIGGRITGRKNVLNLLNQADGEYIAWCDGDDYWTDPRKLQKQVDFLERNAAFVGVGTDYGEVDASGRRSQGPGIGIEELRQVEPGVYETGGCPRTLTVLYRNYEDVIARLEDFNDVANADAVLAYLMRNRGRLAVMDQATGYVRKHAQGVFQGRTYADQCRATLHSRQRILEHVTDREAQRELQTKAEICYNKMVADDLARGDFAAFREDVRSFGSEYRLGWKFVTALRNRARIHLKGRQPEYEEV